MSAEKARKIILIIKILTQKHTFCFSFTKNWLENP